MSKRFSAILVATLIFGSVLAATPPITVPPNFTAPQEQASNLAVPQPGPAPASELAVVYCNQMVGLVVIDDTGAVHPVSLKGATKESITAVLALVPSSKVVAMNLGCPGDPSKNSTVL